MVSLNYYISSTYNQTVKVMEFIKTLLFPKKHRNQAKLKYDKDEKKWMVMKEGSILFLGTEEQCQKYMQNTLTI